MLTSNESLSSTDKMLIGSGIIGMMFSAGLASQPSIAHNWLKACLLFLGALSCVAAVRKREAWDTVLTVFGGLAAISAVALAFGGYFGWGLLVCSALAGVLGLATRSPRDGLRTIAGFVAFALIVAVVKILVTAWLP